METVRSSGFTADSISAMRMKCEELVKMFEKDKKRQKKREVELTVHNVTFKHEIISSRKEYEMRYRRVRT